MVRVYFISALIIFSFIAIGYGISNLATDYYSENYFPKYTGKELNYNQYFISGIYEGQDNNSVWILTDAGTRINIDIEAHRSAWRYNICTHEPTDRIKYIVEANGTWLSHSYRLRRELC